MTKNQRKWATKALKIAKKQEAERLKAGLSYVRKDAKTIILTSKI